MCTAQSSSAETERFGPFIPPPPGGVQEVSGWKENSKHSGGVSYCGLRRKAQMKCHSFIVMFSKHLIVFKLQLVHNESIYQLVTHLQHFVIISVIVKQKKKRFNCVI